jgi:hypothetical protein
MFMKRLISFLVLVGIMASLIALPVFAQDDEEEDEVVYDPEICFAAAEEDGETVQYDAKEGPYIIAISNSYID